MAMFEPREDFIATFVYDNTEYDSKIKRISYSEDNISFRVEYENKHNNTKGTIGHLKRDKIGIWNDEMFLDKDLCQTIGKRIEAYYDGIAKKMF